MAASKESKSKQQDQPDFVLVVVEPFGDYHRGDRIEDAKVISTVMDSDQATHCVRAAR